MQFGIYTATIIENDKLNTIQVDIVHDGDLTQKWIYVSSKDKGQMDVTAEVEPSDIDQHLNLKFRSESGESCKITDKERSCGYSNYLTQVDAGERGIETIRLRYLTNSVYMVYVVQAEKTYSKCKPSEVSYYSHFKSIVQSDSSVVASIPTNEAHLQNLPHPIPITQDIKRPYWVSYCFTGFGQISVKLINQRFEKEPPVDLCVQQYPSLDDHSPAKLKALLESN